MPPLCGLSNLTRKLKLFGDISIYELEEITNRISLLRIPKKTAILKQGKEGHTLYIVYRGSTQVVLNQRFPWRGTDVATLGPGDLLGNVFDAGNPLRHDCYFRRSLAFAIGRELFESLYRSNPYFKEAIDQLVDHRERSLGMMVA